jgi:hypothetical protein
MVPIPRTILSISVETPPGNQSVGGDIGGNRLGEGFDGSQNQKKDWQKLIFFHLPMIYFENYRKGINK